MGTVDDMSGGGKNREFGTWEPRIRTKMLYYPKKHSANLTRDKSSRRQFYEKVGDQSLVHNIDSWIVVPVSPVVEVCCVLTTLVKRVSSLIAREKTEEREAVLK